jgi:hypothetical protein
MSAAAVAATTSVVAKWMLNARNFSRQGITKHLRCQVNLRPEINRRYGSSESESVGRIPASGRCGAAVAARAAHAAG